jgi:transcriptional regulator with XRE-family HTH domain
MKLGELISLSRELRGFSLRELEKRCGVSNALLSQIETGHVKEPGFRTIAKIADALGLSLKRLAGTDEP